MTALLVVTLVSLGLAGVLVAYVLRLTREERNRSEARAAALSALLEEGAAPPADGRERQLAASGQEMNTAGSGLLGAGSWQPQQMHVAGSGRETHVALSGRPAADSDESLADRGSLFAGRSDERAAGSRRLHETHVADSRQLDESRGQPRESASRQVQASEIPAPTFGRTGEEETRGRLVLAPLIGVLVVGLALGGVYAWNRTPAAPATTAAQAQRVAPLELVSLRHQRQNGALVVSGLVRNPHAGARVKGLSAVAFSFDRQGTFIASGTVPIDFPQLAPGDESPFAITLKPSTGIARYRVSFRTGEGVVPHVDRRGEPIEVANRN